MPEKHKAWQMIICNKVTEGISSPMNSRKKWTAPRRENHPVALLTMAAGSTDKSVWGELGEARLVGLHHRAEVSRLSLPTVCYPIHTCVSVNTPPFDQKILLPTLCFSKRELFIAVLLFFLHYHVWCVGGGGAVNMSFSLEFLDKGNNL